MHILHIPNINWYSKLYSVVHWNGAESSALHVKSGVRQGSVLSPLLFNFYTIDLIGSLRNSGLGCHVRDLYVGCIVYADDILLVSCSINLHVTKYA